MKNNVQRILNRAVRIFDKTETELDEIFKYPRYKPGTTNIFGAEFTFHDSLSFYVTYKEIFEGNIYQFKPTADKKLIIDCGANMGLSVVYLSQQYPDHSIIAFEPDAKLFALLQKNIQSLNLQNVTALNKAVWKKDEVLSFYPEGGMGGRLNDSWAKQQPVQVEAVALRNYLTEDVDFLKIDIEGAEDAVLRSCADVLHKAGSVFFEYHNKIGEAQTLHLLLEMLKDAGFTYYIKESSIIGKPFTDRPVFCETFDMALNVFGYKNE